MVNTDSGHWPSVSHQYWLVCPGLYCKYD